jgi:tetratricopeptide (TPR) repeat protein
MPSRLEQLQKMLEREPNDTFLLYGLAMEHKKSGDADQALQLLEKVVQLDPGHGYAFFQRGQIEESRGDMTAAKKAYSDGIIAATKSGDSHARSELEGALSMIES